MKMVKKILLGTLAVAAVLSLASCGKLKDDENKAIKKNSDKKYSIDYENKGNSAYRAYESTNLKHAGALVKVKFDKKDVGTSKMGVIFNLKEDSSTKAKSFYVIGLGGNNSVENFYVSRFSNVTDIQAENFGTKLASNPAVEVEEVPLNNTNKITLPIASDDSVTVYVYFKAIYNTGNYKWAVLELTEAQANAIDIDTWTLNEAPANSILNQGEITGAFTAVSSADSIPQSQHAVYAQVAVNKTLKGSWEYVKTYKEAEEIEE